MTARSAASPVFGAQARSDERARRSAPRRPQLELVEQRARRFRPTGPRMQLLLWFGGSMVLLFALVAFHVVLSQGQFTLQELEGRADDEQAQYERLRNQVAQLESPSRITTEATERLGMVPADKIDPITPGSLQLPRTANGAPAPIDRNGAISRSPSIADDPGRWTEVKPQLNSSAN